MARKFGKKKELILNPLAYTLYLMGEGGIGKTTVIYDYCNKLVGEDGYMFLTCGHEADNNTIDGIVEEPVWNWEHFDEVTEDIIENRFTDYADLKVIVIDTIDELMQMAEQEAIRLWNKDHPDKKTKEFKATWGGFNGPTDKTISLVVDRLWELKRVGVSFIIIGHTKRTENVDAVTQESYSILSTNMDKRYFQAFKNKVDVLGVAYVDRDIAKVKTGRRNIVNGKEEVVGKIQDESRVICFRDDSFSIDSKCRLAYIVDRIPLNADNLIEAITDAIKAEHEKSGQSYEESVKRQEEEAKEFEKVQAERIENIKASRSEEDEESHRPEYIEKISSSFSKATADMKAQIKSMLKSAGAVKVTDPELPIDILKNIADMF